MHTAARSVRTSVRRLRVLELVGFVLLAYLPFLLSSPGRLSSDTKQYLYLDPSRLLSRAPYLWDPHVAGGTVPHQHIGYLFPMGPYYWLMDALRVPDWVAQRVWWGTITLVALLGARWLFGMLGTPRAGAMAGALVYALTPYQLAFTARISVLLLPWAALPWLVGLTMRAARRGGWRDPACFALIVLATGGVNASALLLAGVAPVLWLAIELFRGRDAASAALAAAGRIGALSLGVSLWFAVGLRMQGAFGLPILQLTENVRTVSTASSPDDLLRGLGNWFFYGVDRVGYSIDQAIFYVGGHLVVLASFAIPALALFAATVVRWRHRAYFVLLVIVGVIVGVGAWPYDDPSPYGRVWRTFAGDSSLGLALRNTPRVVPVIVLGIAGLLAAAVGALDARRLQAVAAGVVAALAFAALWPAWRIGFLSDGVERPERLPVYWTAAAAALQRDGNATRVLELPGSAFATYRWGNAVEPVTPGLMDRPYLAREVLPYGTPPSVNLLDALDRRLQEGTFEPASLAPVARLFGVGTVALRSDLAFERSGSPRPRRTWALFTDPLVPGLRPPARFGAARRNVAPAAVAPFDELELSTPSDAADPPPVALFEVKDAKPIVRTAPASRPVVLAGDGDGIVDASAAGLLDGNALVLELAALDREQLGRALDAGADLVLTDSNRRRIQTWFASIRDTKGATERAGQTTEDPNGTDFRLDVFPGATDASRTVVEQRGGLVDASGDGGATRPEDRAAHAFDGDVRTAWRVGGEDPTGEKLVLRTPRPVRAGRVTLVQPQDGARRRALRTVRLRFDGGPAMTVSLGPMSLTPRGQTVRFPTRTFSRLEVELVTLDERPGLNAVGFAEVRIDGVRVTETVRPPVDLAGRVGAAARGHRLDVVLSRLRYEPADRDRQDDELALDRRVVLPERRRFQFAGTGRVNPNAPDDVIDRVLGTVAPGTTFSSSGHLAGDAGARASRAFDGDPATAWTAPFGLQRGQFVDVDLPAPATVDRLELTVVADGRHAVPLRLGLEADGVAVRRLGVPRIRDGSRAGTTRTVTLTFDPVQARRLRLTVDRVRQDERSGPVAISEARFAGVPRPASPGDVPGSCRDDLVALDGRPLRVRLEGPATAARSGLALTACDGPVALGRSARLRARPGLDTGIDVDRVVLASDAQGDPALVTTLGAPRPTSGATVRVERARATSVDLSVRTDGKPFVLELGQSYSSGWKAHASSGSIGSHQVVDGYANGWLVRPSAPGTMRITLRWTPQRVVWAGLAISTMVALVCVAVLLVPVFAPRRPARLAEPPVLSSPLWYEFGRRPSWAATGAVALAIAAGFTLVSRPWIGVVAGGAALLVQVREGRTLIAFAIPTLVAASRVTHTPELAWLALALLAVDLGCGWLRRRASTTRR
jgi:arabinofuranan 3-O-arabinosyltransferase